MVVKRQWSDGWVLTFSRLNCSLLLILSDHPIPVVAVREVMYKVELSMGRLEVPSQRTTSSDGFSVVIIRESQIIPRDYQESRERKV